MSARPPYTAATESVLWVEDTKEIPLLVTGADAKRYLQGRITQDLNKLGSSCGAPSLLLNPQGKIQGQFIILNQADDYLLLSDPLEEEALNTFISSLLQFKVADQVSVEDLRSEFIVSSLIGPNSTKVIESLDASSFKVIHRLRSAIDSVDILLPLAQHKEFSKAAENAVLQLEGAIGSFDDLEMFRIDRAEPRFCLDLDEKISGPEISLENRVCFDKGCYAGQEVVEMTIARGKPNKSFTRFTCPNAINPGADIIAKENSEKRLGQITSSCYFPDRNEAVCLGFLKSNIDETTALSADGEKLSLSPLAN